MATIVSVRVGTWQVQLGSSWPEDEVGWPIWVWGPVRIVKWEGSEAEEAKRNGEGNRWPNYFDDV
jgi:hypothetical protein